MDVQPEEVATQDAAYWANFSKIKLQKGVWSFDRRPYLIEPMQWSRLQRQRKAPRRKCEMKGTQGGFSELEVNESLHGLIHGHYPAGVLYLFPTTDDVREFSKSRFGPLIAANPTTIGQFVQDTDTATLKRIKDAFLYMRGARLSQHLDLNSQESSKLRGIPVDKVVFDEYDLMDDDVATKACERMGDSDVAQEVYVSNPTLPGRGIDSMFKQSDQRYWWRRCVHCGQRPPEGARWDWFGDKHNGWTCAELSFPDLVARDDDGRGYIACAHCGKPVGLEAGCWVPRDPEKSAFMWGYHWSQLSSAARDPWEILQSYTYPPNGNLGDVVRLKLGRAHVDAASELTAAEVLARCGTHLQLNSHPGPCAMGVDQKRHKNVVIGCRIARNAYRIVRVARVKSFDEVLQMAYRFHVKTAVVDLRPYEDEARKFQQKSKFKTWLCEYSDHSPVGTQFSENTGLVKCNRTEALDAAATLLTSESPDDPRVELPGLCPEVKQFAVECAAMVKAQMIDKKTKAPIFRYVTKDADSDDYRHALAYWWIAASSAHLPVVRDEFARQRPHYAKNEYCRA